MSVVGMFSLPDVDLVLMAPVSVVDMFSLPDVDLV